MQNCLLSQAKIPSIAGKNTSNFRQKYPQSQTKETALLLKKPAIAGNTAIMPRVKSPANYREVRLHPPGEVNRNLRTEPQ